MTIVCLDMEGVLVPEIWITFAEMVGMPEFKRTTRDEPDYDKLMCYRIDLLKRNQLTYDKVLDVIESITPFNGAQSSYRIQLCVLRTQFVARYITVRIDDQFILKYCRPSKFFH